MRDSSRYLPWSKVAGSSLLLGVPVYIWASACLRPQLASISWQAVLAASLTLQFALLVWADRSAGSRPLRASLMVVITLSLVAVVLGAFTELLPPWVLPLSLFLTGSAVACLIWQADRSEHAWQRKSLWAFVLAAVPSVLFRAGFLSEGPSLFMLSLLMIAGLTVCLADSQGSAKEKRSGKRLALLAALVFLLGCLVSSVAPGASSAASWGLRGILSAAKAVFLELLKPVSIVVEWLINALLAIVRKGTETENPANPFEPGQMIREVREQPTPVGWTVFGWILAFAAIALIVRKLWEILTRYAKSAGDAGAAEERTSDWSSSKAAAWASEKVRELAKPLLDFLAQRFGEKRTASNPVVAIYSDFLSLAAQAGYPKAPSQTPLEFSRVFSQAVPSLSEEITTISSLFSKRFYSGREATPEELESMMGHLANLRSLRELDRKDGVL